MLAAIFVILPVLMLEQKHSFVQSLTPPGGADCILSESCPTIAAAILDLLGGGHPGNIVNLACDLDSDSTTEIRSTGISLIRDGMARSELEGGAV